MDSMPYFVELPPFEKVRENYLNDQQYMELQQLLITNPKAGDVIAKTGGLRKIRFEDKRRNKGRRGGLRVIYYYHVSNTEFLMFTVYDKNEASDLSNDQRAILKQLLQHELQARKTDY